MSETKITKVLLEFEDGTARYIEGEEATKWKRAVDAINIFAYAHGYQFPLLDWRNK